MLALSFAIFSVLYLAPFSSAIETCTTVRNGGTIQDNVVVPAGATCTLAGVTITGSVDVSMTAKLSTEGLTVIQGPLTASDGGSLSIGAATVVQGALSLTAAGDAIVSGSVASISVRSSSNFVQLFAASITSGGIKVEKSTTRLNLCGASVVGGVYMSENSGSFSACATSACSPSMISGSVEISNGSGNVELCQANMESSDIVLDKIDGAVSLDTTNLSDVSASKVTGRITMSRVTTDSDVSVVESGSLAISDCAFFGDVELKSNAAVALHKSSFQGENVAVVGNSGPVSIEGLFDTDILVEENNDVVLSNNNVDSASVNKNTGRTVLNGNVFGVLSCSSNSPPPTGSGNSVSKESSKQCAGGLV